VSGEAVAANDEAILLHFLVMPGLKKTYELREMGFGLSLALFLTEMQGLRTLKVFNITKVWT